MKHKTRKKRIVRRKRRVVRRNPYITKDDGQRVLYGYAKNDMQLLGTGLKISKGNLVLLTPATNIPGGGYFARPGYPTGLWKQLSEEVASIYIRPSDFKNEITFKKTAFGSKEFMRQMRSNPPMYAHRMNSHRTHGLSLKQMMKLYRLVSSGNPKAVMYARRTLGIPMSESLSQVKAVVYHHVMDLKGKI